MDSLVRRLKYYGIGFSIGLIFVIFFFQSRGCSWTPGNRVKSSILQRSFAFPESQAANLKAANITGESLVEFVQDADVNFNDSKKKAPNKYYKLTKEGKNLYFTLTNESFITSVFTTKPKLEESRKGKAELVRFPENNNLVFTDTTGTLLRIRTELGFENDKEVFDQMKKKVYINFEKSDFVSSIKPEHYLEFTSSKGKTIGVKTIWYKDKINISEYIYQDTL